MQQTNAMDRGAVGSHNGGFDSVVVLRRGNRCLVGSVCPPFGAAYWPDLGALAKELGLGRIDGAALGRPGPRAAFLAALAEQGGMGPAFRPACVGCRTPPEEIRRREGFRRRNQRVVFQGDCPRQVVLAALELAARRVRRGATVSAQFKGWDALAAWPEGSERIRDAASYLYQSWQRRASFLVYSELRELPTDQWAFVYDLPSLRVAWVAWELLGCRRPADFDRRGQRSAALRNLGEMGGQGLWPHVVLPVSEANVLALPDLAQGLLEVTRGGSIELAPVGLLAGQATVQRCRLQKREGLPSPQGRNPRGLLLP
jgi:hypothetical protein